MEQFQFSFLSPFSPLLALCCIISTHSSKACPQNLLEHSLPVCWLIYLLLFLTVSLLCHCFCVKYSSLPSLPKHAKPRSTQVEKKVFKIFFSFWTAHFDNRFPYYEVRVLVLMLFKIPQPFSTAGTHIVVLVDMTMAHATWRDFPKIIHTKRIYLNHHDPLQVCGNVCICRDAALTEFSYFSVFGISLGIKSWAVVCNPWPKTACRVWGWDSI